MRAGFLVKQNEACVFVVCLSSLPRYPCSYHGVFRESAISLLCEFEGVVGCRDNKEALELEERRLDVEDEVPNACAFCDGLL